MVVNNGEIIEQGTHDDLIAADGKYAELWSKQVRMVFFFLLLLFGRLIVDGDCTQIFVKPRAEESSDEEESTDPKKSAENVTTHEVPESEDATKDDTQQCAGLKTPSGHKKEV